MAFTTIDPNTALLVIDLQRGIVGSSLAHPAGDVVDTTVALIGAFRRHSLPIVFATVTGSPPGRTDRGPSTAHEHPAGWTALIPELDQQAADIVITKNARSAFSGTGLSEQLRELGVTQVVIVGIATSGGVESTARDAHERGFHVTLPVDAMTDTALTAHQHSVRKSFPRIAESGTTDELLRLLECTLS
jgi:nicotinamidase-related amidase